MVKELALEGNLIIIGEKQIDFEELKFSYVIAERKVEEVAFPVLSEYFLVELTSENIKGFKGKQSYDRFNQFQQKLISQTFFKLRNDLRWNLYLIFVFQDTAILDDVSIADIEKDENFARKYFFDESGAINFLKRSERIKYVEPDSESANPIQEWYSGLEKVSFSNALYKDFATEYVKKYIYEGVSFNFNENITTYNEKISQENDDILINQTKFKYVKEIDISNFRPHCFNDGEKFRPACINLLFGNNGSGKSSILESIEYALTGKIKKKTEFKDYEGKQGLEIRGITEYGDDISLSSNGTTAECKELDKLWYGTPIGRNACTLNENFNYFNCFNAESAYRFALDESKNDNDYEGMFTNLFFDNNFTAMQKRWQRYEQEFIEQKRKMESKCLEIKEYIANLEKKLKENANVPIENLIFNLKDLPLRVRYIKDDSNEKPEESYEKLLLCLQKIEPIANKLKLELEKRKIRTLLEVNERNKVLKVKVIELTIKQKQDDEKKLEETQNIKKKEIELKNLKQSIIKNNGYIEELKNTLNDWEKIKLVVNNFNKAEAYQELVNMYDEIEHAKKILQIIYAQYPNIKLMQVSDVNECLSETDLLKLNEELKNYNEKLRAIDFEIQAAQKNIDKYNSMKLQLKDIAISMIDLNKDSINKCPVCGSVHDSHEILINKINTILTDSQSDKAFLEMQYKKKFLQEKIEGINTALSKYNKSKENRAKLLEIVKILNSMNVNISVDLNHCKLLLSVQENLKNISNKILINQNLKSKIEIYKVDGFNEENILKAKEFMKTNPYFIGLESLNGENKGFRQYITSLIQKQEKENAELEEKINLVYNDIAIINQKITVFSSNEIADSICNAEKEIGSLSKIISDYGSCKEFFDINDAIDLIDWYSVVKRTSLQLEMNLRFIRERESIKRQEEEINEKKRKRDELCLCHERCERVIVAFEKMPRLEDFVSVFLEKNIDSIDYFFKLIHTPREFSGIELESDDRGNRKNLIAKRESDKKDIKIYQMSTGQRASLALAVLFSRHLSASSAPRFLLLDEPVANMDDMHLMNLLDILRDFALQGTQIIFTTANPTVAGLFRRKFSFFGEKFIHFELTRSNSEKTCIETYSYNPNEEVAISLKPVS